MKHFLAILISLVCFSAQAASRITATITVTNVPAYPNALTVNGNVRTWTNSTAGAPATSLLIGASIGATATNLYNQIGAYSYSGPLVLGFSSSNVITLKGQISQSMSASISGTWASISYATNPVTQMLDVRVPLSSESSSVSTNIATLLASGLGTYAQSPLATNTTLVQNLVQVDGNQTIAGNKTFTGDLTSANFYSGNINATGSVVVSNTTPSIYVYTESAAADEGGSYFSQESGPGLGFYFLNDLGVTTQIWYASRSGATCPLFSIYPTVTLGLLANTGATNTTATNTTLYGVYLKGSINTSLASGDNAAVAISTDTKTTLKAGPAGAFAICGIAGGLGFDGRYVILVNRTGFTMTIKHDSGGDPTASNRIYTATSGNITVLDKGSAILIYDNDATRWILVSPHS